MIQTKARDTKKRALEVLVEAKEADRRRYPGIAADMDALAKALDVERVLRGAALVERANGNISGPMYAAHEASTITVIDRAITLVNRSKS